MIWLAQFVAWLWLTWVFWNVLQMVFGPLLMDAPCTNGLWVHMPKAFRARLTDEEAAAVVAHERGHIVRLHVPRNLVMRCLFLPESRERYERFELEADDYAAAHGHGLALYHVLTRFARTPFDQARARRLLARSA